MARLEMSVQKSLVLHRRSTLPGAGPTCIDLFSGAGGLAVGFKEAGWSVLAANDLDRGAGETFRLNFPESSFYEGPISELEAGELLKECSLEIGQLDCLIGGPPCQSFSHNNHQRSATDARARLFDDYLRLVEGLNPKTLVMENVPGILSIDGGRVIEEIERRIGALGYNVTHAVLSAEEFGTPQIRKRVFIVGTRLGAASDLLPVATHLAGTSNQAGRSIRRGSAGTRLKPCVSVQEAIGDLPPLLNGGGCQKTARPAAAKLSSFQREARRGVRTIFNHVCHALTDVNLNRIVHVPEGGNWRDIPRELLTAGMQRARPSDHTKRYGRLDRAGLASTLLTKCDPHWGAYVHPTQDRTISVREAARLQGFPDKFRFAGDSIGRHYEQVGNAVPVPVARALGNMGKAHLAAASVYEPAESDSLQTLNPPMDEAA